MIPNHLEEHLQQLGADIRPHRQGTLVRVPGATYTYYFDRNGHAFVHANNHDTKDNLDRGAHNANELNNDTHEITNHAMAREPDALRSIQFNSLSHLADANFTHRGPNWKLSVGQTVVDDGPQGFRLKPQTTLAYTDTGDINDPYNKEIQKFEQGGSWADNSEEFIHPETEQLAHATLKNGDPNVALALVDKLIDDHDIHDLPLRYVRDYIKVIARRS